MLKEYWSFSPFQPLLFWKASQTTLTTSIPLCSWTPEPPTTWMVVGLVWMIWNSVSQSWFINGLYCIICFCIVWFNICCVFLDLHFSSIYVHTNVSWSVLLHVNAYTLVMFVLLYWMGVRMCVAILFSVTLYFRDVPLWVLFLLPLPFPSSPSSLPIVPTPPAHWGCGTKRNWMQEKRGEGYSQKTAQDNWEGEEEKDKEKQT